MPKWLRDALVAISLANLCFLSSWLILLNPNHYVYYFWKNDPGFSELISLVVAVLLLATLFWIARRLLKGRVVRWAFLVVLTWPVNSFLIDYAKLSVLESALKSHWGIFVLVMIAGALLFLIWRKQDQMIAAGLSILVILSPLILVNVAVSMWLRHQHPQPVQAQQQTIAERKNGPRIVWIIFDELQWQMVFENRPPNLKLPEFDRLMGESVHFTHAYPPSWQTLTSMPALLSGQFVKSAAPKNESELELETEQGTFVDWSKQTSVFSEAKKAGFTTGVAGWYHPYCRLPGNDLDVCYWTPQLGPANPALGQLGFSSAFINNVTVALLRIPFLFRLSHRLYERKQRNDHAAELREVFANSSQIISQHLNLTLLHFPVPHSPWINEARMDAENIDGYLDNVTIADRTLGDLRSLMGTGWDETIVVVSADHWWRDAPRIDGKRDHRVPFMVKLAGQQVGVEYQGAFNTILTRMLLLELLKGEMKSSSAVVEWIDRNSQLGETSLTANAP
ncbi:MAG TPA: sulfatase-like hydrolase/transferase [Pyrinomonadaceae bacterium]